MCKFEVPLNQRAALTAEETAALTHADAREITQIYGGRKNAE